MRRKDYDDRDTELAAEMFAAEFDLCTAEHSYKKRFLSRPKLTKTEEKNSENETVE